MQVVLPLFSVAEKDFNKEISNFLHLKKALLLQNIGGDKVS
jgi:hypothetical protein